jgi:hypothetical protein
MQRCTMKWVFFTCILFSSCKSDLNIESHVDPCAPKSKEKYLLAQDDFSEYEEGQLVSTHKCKNWEVFD